MVTSAVPIKRRSHLFEEMDGESLIYRTQTKQGVYLNDTATVIWRLCDGQRDVDAIIDALGEIYPDRGADIASDVPDTIHRLVSFGALKLAAATPSGAEAAASAVAAE